MLQWLRGNSLAIGGLPPDGSQSQRRLRGGLQRTSRNAGSGPRVGLGQFIKGTWRTGDLVFVQQIPEIDHVASGDGFTRETRINSARSLSGTATRPTPRSSAWSATNQRRHASCSLDDSSRPWDLGAKGMGSTSTREYHHNTPQTEFTYPPISNTALP